MRSDLVPVTLGLLKILADRQKQATRQHAPVVLLPKRDWAMETAERIFRAQAPVYNTKIGKVQATVKKVTRKRSGGTFMCEYQVVVRPPVGPVEVSTYLWGLGTNNEIYEIRVLEKRSIH